MLVFHKNCANNKIIIFFKKEKYVREKVREKMMRSQRRIERERWRRLVAVMMKVEE